MFLFNTLTRRKEPFIPLQPNRAGIYSCGPTVYGPPHIGNLRAFIFSDILRRTLEFFNYDVTQVMNITDVGHLTSDANEGEDKLEKGARVAGKTVWEVAHFYEQKFLDALKALNIKTPHHLPRATDHISEQVALIKKLTAKGYTYETGDGIYFDTQKFQNYGQLSRQKLEEKSAGARVKVKEEKRHPADFALWKFCVGENKDHAMRWDFETGESVSQLKIENCKLKIGFPGWHIECSAMSMKYLGETFDIHTGGIDHVPVHHENEIAQSEAALDHPFVKYWLHNEFLTIVGGKMSKSLGNLFTLEDLAQKGFDPLAFRLLCLGTHYRQKLNFSWEALEGAQNRLKRLRLVFQDTLKISNAGTEPTTSQKFYEKYLKEFSKALADDLNTALALAVLEEVSANSQLTKEDREKLILNFDSVLGLDFYQLNIEEKIELTLEQQKLLTEREHARAEKNWQRADEIREEFLQMGLSIEDTAAGQSVKKLKVF